MEFLEGGTLKEYIQENSNNITEDIAREIIKQIFNALSYKLLKNTLISNKTINPETIIITDQFLCSENSKELFIKYKATYKKNIIICIQNSQTLKWTIIAFLNLEEQIKKLFNMQ